MEGGVKAQKEGGVGEGGRDREGGRSAANGQRVMDCGQGGG